MSWRLGFYVGQLGLRGTDQFVWSLAHHCELRGHTCFVVTSHRQPDSPDVTRASQDRFRSRFLVLPLMPEEKLDSIADRYGLHAMYVSKWGRDDGMVTHAVPCVVHAIFDCCEPHGDAYLSISDHMVAKCRASCGVLPFIVDLPPPGHDLRAALGVPADAFVFGRHGGWNQFDVPLAQAAVARVLNRHPDVYFLFLNTRAFGPAHPRLIHLPAVATREETADFVHACDAMCHARSDGETFGLACGEFSVCNRPVVTTDRGDRAHIAILEGQCLVGHDEAEYAEHMDALVAAGRDRVAGGRWDAYRRFSPDAVVDRFEAVLRGLVRQ